MHTLLTALALMAIGWFAWTFSEYALHRWAMHELMGRGLLSREHLAHHTAPNRTGLGKLTVLQWTGILLVGAAVTLPVVLAAGARGWYFGVGWALGYAWYEIFHARSHLRPPMRVFRRYDLRLRHHHFHHHFGHPMSNHGVTMALWDRVFGTYERAGRITVPHAAAPSWLLGPDGRVPEEFAEQYLIVGDPASRAARREAIAAARASVGR